MKITCTKCGWEAEGRYCTRCGFLKKPAGAQGATAVAVPQVELHSQPNDHLVATQEEPETDGVDMVRGNGHHEARWEYKHVFITTAKAVGLDDAAEKVTRTQVKSYKTEKIEKELQVLGDDGWEVVSMEPHWFWERLNGNTSPETARPRVITGWYCTFKRQVDPATMALN